MDVSTLPLERLAEASCQEFLTPARCQDILTDMARYSGGPVTHRALVGPGAARSLPKSELLRILTCIRDVRAKIDANELRTVRMARESGITWTEIATALGVSRQAAWERLREMDVDLSTTPV